MARRRRNPAGRDERGVALVEAAIVTPLLLMLVFGIIEFGLLFKDSLTIANAARAGARVGTSQGNDPMADYQILQAVAGASGSLASVTKVIVFDATGPNGAVPAACVSSSVGVAGVCNVYTAADLTVDAVTFASAGYTNDDYWPSASRITSLSAANGPDYLGVWVQAHHTSVVQLIVGDRDLTDTVVMRMEPSR
jgi:Flp pilus assembly protein TadG